MSTKNNTSSLRRQAVTTAIIAGVTLVLVLLYVTVVRGLLTEEPKDTDALLQGEVKLYNSIYMYAPFSSEEMQSIVVNNEHGGFTIERGDDNSFYLNENTDAPYSPALFASLSVAVGNTMTRERIEPAPDNGTEPEYIDYANYGLSDELESGSFTVTMLTGKSYTVHIGYAVSSGDGYYARLEGRNAVYIVQNDVKDTVLAPVENIVTPMLGFPTNTNDYQNIDNFSIWHDGKHFVTVHKLADDEEVAELAASSNYVMAFETDITSSEALACDTGRKMTQLFGTKALNYAYVPTIDRYGELLSGFSTLQGEKTVAIKKPGEESITADQLMEFGIDPTNPAHELFYTYNGVNSYIIFSEKKDGYYYAYSFLFDIIATIPESKVAMLDWQLDRWVEPAFFQRNIQKVSKISLVGDGIDVTFDLTFTAQQGADSAPLLSVKVGNNFLDTRNFREFYKVILTRNIRGEFYGEVPGEDALRLTMTVTTDAGVEKVFKFYSVSTQRMYLTIDGVGRFYVLSSSVRELISDALKCAQDQPIDAYDRK